MKSHPNYILRGGLKMKKNRTRKSEIATLSVSILPSNGDEEKIAQEETARIYRESVMHLRVDSPEKTEV
ncbi:MAG TPA: hypothetical protein VK658_06740 [Chryseolinea sp.]|nr:hypothetical protein [Chryseolinea sp.]